MVTRFSHNDDTRSIAAIFFWATVEHDVEALLHAPVARVGKTQNTQEMDELSLARHLARCSILMEGKKKGAVATEKEADD